MAERLREMRFPHDGRALDQNAVVPFDKVAGGQVEDLLPIDGGVKGKIESLQRLVQIHRGPAQPQLQLLVGPSFDFIFDQALEEVDVGQLLADRLLGADLERRQNPGEPQTFQFRDKLMIQLHDPHPVEGKKSVTGRAKERQRCSRGRL